MDFLHGSQPSFLQTQLTQRMRRSIAVTDSFPSPAVLLVAVSGASVLVVPFPGSSFMFLTVLPVREVWTAGYGAGAFWFLWHAAPRFPGKRKALQDCSARLVPCPVFLILTISQGQGVLQWLLVAYFGNGVQRPVVEPVQPPKLISHVHGDLLPGFEAQIPQLQQGLGTPCSGQP